MHEHGLSGHIRCAMIFPSNPQAGSLIYGKPLGGCCLHWCRHASLPSADAVAVAKHPLHGCQGCRISVQCEPAACREMEARYGVKPRVSEREAFNNRFLMVIDGNTFSSRHGHCASTDCILAAWPAPANFPAAALCTLQVHSAFLH